MNFEKYTTLNSLGEGYLGKTYLIKYPSSELKYALKKIECADEFEARCLFKEINEIIKKQDSKDFALKIMQSFIEWDEKISTFYFCTITTYYQVGSLFQYFQIVEQGSEFIAENTVLSWTAQLVDGLYFLHDANIIHGNLKASNIFLNDRNQVLFGEFSLTQTFKAAFQNPRAPLCGSVFVAPEFDIAGGNLTSASDIWSLGLVLAQLFLVPYFTMMNFKEALIGYKYDPKRLINLILAIGAARNMRHVKSTVEQMLNADPEKRPSIEQISVIHFIREHLEILKQSKMYKTNEAYVKLVEDQKLDYYILYLNNNIKSYVSIYAALQYLKDKFVDVDPFIPAEIVDSDLRIFIECLNKYMIFKDVIALTLNCIVGQLFHVNESSYLLTTECITPIIKALETHKDSIEVCKHALTYLGTIYNNDMAVDTIASLDGIPIMLDALEVQIFETVIVEIGLTALLALVGNDRILKIASDLHASKCVILCMEKNMHASEVFRLGCACLLAFSLKITNIFDMCICNAIPLIIYGLKSYDKRVDILQVACQAIAALIDQNDESLYLVVNGRYMNMEYFGVKYLLSLCTGIYAQNQEAIISILSVIKSCCRIDDVVSELESQNTLEILTNINDHFAGKFFHVTELCSYVCGRIFTLKPIIKQMNLIQDEIVMLN